MQLLVLVVTKYYQQVNGHYLLRENIDQQHIFSF